MRFPLWQTARAVMAGVLVVIFAFPSNLVAQSHLVSLAKLQKETLATSTARQNNLRTVTQFFSSERAEKALKSAHMDPMQVKAAVSTLSDEELAQLAARSAKAQADLAAGRLEDRDLMWILVAIAALVLLIVAVR